MMNIPSVLAAGVTLAGCVQAAAGFVAVRRFIKQQVPAATHPAVSILKPLHGDEPLLEEALASFCRQDYPEFQIICGVQRVDDPAVAVVRRLQARFPDVDIALVVNGARHGAANLKVANLINMYPAARHEVLVVSDSDMHVPPDYLSRVVDALAMPGAGLVTTLYTGRPAHGGIAGQLGAAHIAQSFAPGALMARWLGRQDCMGATMALSRETLLRIGGFPALAQFVADDAVLGAKIRALGLRVELARCAPATTVPEAGLAALCRHELRWARTIRAIEPIGFAASVMQYPGFWALLTVAVSGGADWAMLLWACTIALRGLLGRCIEHAMGAVRTAIWLPALRDVMSIAVLAAAYMGRGVAWRGRVLSTRLDTDFAAGRAILAPGGGR